MIIKLQNRNILKLSKEESDYLNWRKLSPKQKRQSRINKAKAYLNSGPNITNFWNAFLAYIGNKDPKNPHLNIGIVNVPGRATPRLILLSAKLMETINNYWKNLGKLKIRLGGNGKYASGILTKPGTAPTTFNGQNINYITSPKGGNVTHKFYTDQGSEYILTKDGFARRVKSSHANTGGADAGLHEWNKGATRFLDSDELGWSYHAWTDRTKPLGFSEKDGIISLVTKDNGKWRYVMRSELRPNAIKNGTIKDGIILSAYTTEPKIGKWMLEYGTNPTGEINWFHPGSQVAFIEGLKQGGSIKTANARKWKHKDGGVLYIFLQGGVLLTFGDGGITDSLIDFVILKEGFNETPTDIGDGKITIGSGLTAKKWIDLYNLKGVWSKEDNRAAVTEELLNRLKWALETVPNWNKLNKNLQDALLSYKYNYDFNHINSPKLFDYLRKGDFYNASQEINATSKDNQFKKGLEQRRLEERNLFNTRPIENYPVISEKRDRTSVNKTYYPKQYRIIPTKQGSYIETDKGLILKEILDTRMKLLKIKPRIPEPYKFPILFKKGGKGFVKNVNVLDSNPRLYKEEKKRFPIKKAAFGLKLSNIGNKINTFMNSDWGLFAKSALTGIKDIVSADKLVSANADLARANVELNYANKIKNAGDLYKLYLEENTLKSQQLAATIKALSGDTINVSPIDIAHKAWQLAYSGLGPDLKAKDIRIIDNQEIADKTNNIMNGIVQSGLEALGNYLSNNTPMKLINKSNLNYINNYLSVTSPLNYMKSIKELGNFLIK